MKIRRMFNLDTITTKVGTDDAEKPLCPHCGKPLAEIVSHRSDYVGLGNLHVMSCPKCRKVLGTACVMK